MSSAASKARGKSQTEADLDRLLDLGGGSDFGRGVPLLIAELADTGVDWEAITERVTAAGMLHGRTYATDPPWFLADPTAAYEWALGEVERERRRRGRAEHDAANPGLVVVNAAELLRLGTRKRPSKTAAPGAPLTTRSPEAIA